MAKRTGLGRGIGALIPTTETAQSRPVDVFFPQAVKPANGQSTPESTEPSAQASAVLASAAKMKERKAATSKSAPKRTASKPAAKPAAASAPTFEETSAAPASQSAETETQSAETETQTVSAPSKAAAKPAAKPARATAAKSARKAPSAPPASASAAPSAPEQSGSVSPADVLAPSVAATLAAPAAEPGIQADAPEDAQAGAEPTASTDAAPASDSAPVQEPDDDAPELVEVPGLRLIQVDPATVVPNPRQPRTEFDPEDLAELVHSVREFGVLQPIVVRTRDDGTYELIMGERRTRAAREAGLTEIPAIIRETADEDLLRDALLENLHRSELNPLEEASAYQQLLDDFGITHEELATRLGRSRPQVSNTLRLLKLPVAVQQRVAAGVLSAGHARAILSVSTPEGMSRLADKIVNEDLSVRAAEAAAKTIDQVTATRTAAPAPSARRVYLDDVASRLGDRLNTRVKIDLGARKGKMSIEFATVADLKRILSEIGETDLEA